MQVRSGKEEPSVEDSSQTESKSMSAPVRELSAPPSADQPKLLSTPAQVKSARGVVGERTRKYNRKWCYPGKGTPSAPRTGRTPPVRVGGTSVQINEVLNLETPGRRGRFPRSPGLRKILEKRNEPQENSSVMGSNRESGISISLKKCSGEDSIYARDASTKKISDGPSAVFPPARMRLKTGERADYLSEFTRAVGGEVLLDRRHHTTGVQLFAGSKALRTHACKALLDTGSPASFIQEKVWLRMLACGAASEDGLTTVDQKTWGGFHGVPLHTSSHVRLNIQIATNKNSRSDLSPMVCMVVHAHIVPTTAMTTAVLLGRDSWAHFPTREYKDISISETRVTFVENENDNKVHDHRYATCVNNAIGMIEKQGKDKVVPRVASHRHRLPNAMSWLKVCLTNSDDTNAEEGSYYIRFGPEWFPQEAIVESGFSEIPILSTTLE